MRLCRVPSAIFLLAAGLSGLAPASAQQPDAPTVVAIMVRPFRNEPLRRTRLAQSFCCYRALPSVGAP
jgi:hypothetical protein